MDPSYDYHDPLLSLLMVQGLTQGKVVKRMIAVISPARLRAIVSVQVVLVILMRLIPELLLLL